MEPKVEVLVEEEPVEEEPRSAMEEELEAWTMAVAALATAEREGAEAPGEAPGEVLMPDWPVPWN